MNLKSNLIRLSLFALICLIGVSSAVAGPYLPCATSNLNTSATANDGSPYENADGSANGYECTIGNLLFSNFHSATPSVLPSTIGVQPGFQPANLPPGTPGNTYPGFEFSGPWSVSGNNVSEDVNVEFTVTALTGTISDVFIDLNNSHVTGTGDVSYTETVCPSNSGCTLYVDNPNTADATDEINIAPTTSINIDKDLELHAGSNGTATMSAFSNYYSSPVPEPREVSIVLGLGFLGIMAFMKKRQAVRS